MNQNLDYKILRIWQSVWIASITKDEALLEKAAADHAAWHAQNGTDPAASQRLIDIVSNTAPDERRARLARIRSALALPELEPHHLKQPPKRGRRKKAA